jgi:hypothetical protein
MLVGPPVDGVVVDWMIAGGTVGGCVPEPGGVVPPVVGVVGVWVIDGGTVAG